MGGAVLSAGTRAWQGMLLVRFAHGDLGAMCGCREPLPPGALDLVG